MLSAFNSKPPKNLLLVINPISGDTDKDEIMARIEDFCSDHRMGLTFLKTTGDAADDQNSIREFIKTTAPDAVVAVGGDGTVHLVATALIGTNVPLGIVPLGSGNGFSKDLKIPQEVDEALELLRRFHVATLDTLVVQGVPCIHLSDVGFNALVVQRFTEDTTRGFTTYAWHTLREYLGYEPHHYEVITDQGSFSGKAFMVAIANANTFGSNATINPIGRMDDGLFEICVLEEFPKLEGFSILYQLFNSEINQSLRARFFQCTRATIHNPELALLQVDGEVMETAETIEAGIRPASLRVILSPEFEIQNEEGALL